MWPYANIKSRFHENVPRIGRHELLHFRGSLPEVREGLLGLIQSAFGHPDRRVCIRERVSGGWIEDRSAARPSERRSAAMASRRAAA
jgi:hypothetical protein